MLKALEWLVVLAFVALILAAVGIAYLSSPPPGHPTEQQTAAQSEDKKQAEEQRSLRGFVRFLFPDGIAVFTFFLVLATVTLGWVAIVQIGYLERAEKISSESAKAAKDAADAANKSVTLAADTAQRQLRAYLYVAAGQAPTFEEWSVKGVQLILKNYGQTPAYDVSFWHGVDLREIPLSGPLRTPDKPLANSTKTVLNPSQTNEMIVRVGRPIKTEEQQLILNRTHGLYVYGAITYRDAFGIGRTSKFRYIYQAFDVGSDTQFRGMQWAPEGNEAD